MLFSNVPVNQRFLIRATKPGCTKSAVLQICLVLEMFYLMQVWLSFADFLLTVNLIYQLVFSKTRKLTQV